VAFHSNARNMSRIKAISQPFASLSVRNCIMNVRVKEFKWLGTNNLPFFAKLLNM